jgi:transcriptional regulator with XRE-family HTH domain
MAMDNRLKELIAMRGFTVSEFARRTGVKQPTMHKIVEGKVRLESIQAEHFMRIACGLGISAEELYFGDTSYDAMKSLVDRVFATTCMEGRQAIVANAIGVSHAYRRIDGACLPTIRDDINALKAL